MSSVFFFKLFFIFLFVLNVVYSEWNRDTRPSAFLHSTPPACGPSTWQTADQIPTTHQHIKHQWTPPVCSTDLSLLHSSVLSFSPLPLPTIRCLARFKPNVLFAGWLKQNLRTFVRSHLTSQEGRNYFSSFHARLNHLWCLDWAAVVMRRSLDSFVLHLNAPWHVPCGIQRGVAVARTLEVLPD